MEDTFIYPSKKYHKRQSEQNWALHDRKGVIRKDFIKCRVISNPKYDDWYPSLGEFHEIHMSARLCEKKRLEKRKKRMQVYSYVCETL